MARTKISEFSATPGNNTDIDGINIAEGCAPSGINDAIRELMAQLKDFQAGTAGDSFNGPVGTTTPAAGAFTNLSASGTFALTGDQVQISEGGTGQTTANAAFNALAPSQTSNSGKYLKTDGTNTSWDAIDINTADITGTLPIANGGTGLTALGTGVQTALGQNVTGSGGIVLASSPSLTTPNLGTPSAVTLTNATGLPLSTGVTGTLATTNGGTGLTSFTANGVVYASSTSALTTGSALSFDGTNLSNSGYYIGTAAVGRLTKSNTTGRNLLTGGITGGTTDGAYIITEGYDYGGTAAGGAINLVTAGASSPITMLINGTEQMRLTSTGLGIGTSSPLDKLDVVSANTTYRNRIRNSGAYEATLLFQNSSSGTATNDGLYLGIVGSLDAYLWNYENNPIIFGTNNTERMRLDSSGNLGLGVTPSSTNYGRWLFIGSAGNSVFGASNDMNMTANAYYNGNWLYGTSTFASRYQQASGQHVWFTAASGTAGNTISFTQAMTLDASGNLIVGGTTTPSGKANNFINEGGSGGFWTKSGGVGYFGTFDNYAMVLATNDTERARITSGGSFNIGTTSLGGDNLLNINNSSSTGYGISVYVNNDSSTTYRYFEGYSTSASTQRIVIYTNGDVRNSNNSYGALSDAKLKQDIVDAGSQWNDIKALRVRKYRFRDQPDSALHIGLIAQEAETVSPGLITEHQDEKRNENGSIELLDTTTKSLKYSVLYMKAIKALQEAMARIEQLEAKVAALEAK